MVRTNSIIDVPYSLTTISFTWKKIMSDEIPDLPTLTENGRQSSTDSHDAMCRVVLQSSGVHPNTLVNVN